MQGCAELSAVLEPAFRSADIQKLALELTSDMSKLAGSYEHMTAFHEAQHCLDLKSLWGLHREHVDSPVDSPTQTIVKHRQVGLSFLSKRLFGKPLDKSMQVRRSGMHAASDLFLMFTFIQLALANAQCWLRGDAPKSECNEESSSI